MISSSIFRASLLVLSFATASLALAADAPKVKDTLPPIVTVATVLRSELVDSVQVTGTLVAREEVLVSPEIEGLRIVELLADEGDSVVKGQVLARLARETLDAQLAQSSAALLRADAAIAQSKSLIAQYEALVAQKTNTLVRAKTLKQQGVTTDASLDLAVADAATTQAQLASARDGQRLAEADKANTQALRQELQVRISRTEVKAPTGGIVSRRAGRLGAMAAGAADAMFRIIADGAVELEAEVPELRMAKMQPGQPASVSLGDIVNIRGKLRLVSPEVDKSSRLGKVRIALDKNPALRIGAFARGLIEIDRRMALSVPLSAVLYNSEGPFVQGVRDNLVFTAPVKLGFASGSQIEIVDGVAEGASIIAKAGSFLHEGDVVRTFVPPAKNTSASIAPAAAEIK